MATKPQIQSPDTESEKPKRKSLAELSQESCTVEMHRGMLHQSADIPGAGMETSLNNARKGQRDMKLIYHPGYGLIGKANGKYFLIPSANIIIGYE
jgi:hypothetical protein